MLTRGKVILFYPPYDGPPLGAPLCLLALAASLREANFDVVMIDAAIEPDYLTRIECESVDALCIGISVLTGPMIRGAIEAAPGHARGLRRRGRHSALFLPVLISFLRRRRIDHVLGGRAAIGT